MKMGYAALGNSQMSGGRIGQPVLEQEPLPPWLGPEEMMDPGGGAYIPPPVPDFTAAEVSEASLRQWLNTIMVPMLQAAQTPEEIDMMLAEVRGKIYDKFGTLSEEQGVIVDTLLNEYSYAAQLALSEGRTMEAPGKMDMVKMGSYLAIGGIGVYALGRLLGWWM